MRILRRFSNAVMAMCAFVAVSCGGGSGFNLNPEDLTIAGFTAGYDPDTDAIRVSWLEIVHPEIARFIVHRTEPISAFAPIPTSDIELSEYSTLGPDEFLLEDTLVDRGQRYGYQVQIAFNNPEKVTADVQSDIVWAAVPGTGSIDDIKAKMYPGICDAVTETAFINRIGLNALSDSLDAAVQATAEAVGLEARWFQQGRAQVHWKKVAVGQTFANADDWGNTKSIDLLTQQCTTREFRTWEFGIADASDLGSNQYTLVAELQLFGTGDKQNTLIPPSFWVSFPDPDAENTLQLHNASPAPGSVLQEGFHQFTAEPFARLENPVGKNMSVRIVAVDSDGKEALLDIQTFALETQETDELFSSIVQIPSGTQIIRMIGRVGTGTLNSTFVQDEVDYVVVP